MPNLTAALADLKGTLGDYLDRGRPDGVFHAQIAGPGSVPALADLDVPELHVDLMPHPPTDAQLAALRGLGYHPTPDGWRHPGGWRLLLPDHGSGWRAAQKALHALLGTDPAAAEQYRAVYVTQGRAAADAAMGEQATAHHARTVGLSPAEFIARTLEPLDGPWMFAAGVALDLHHGHLTRPHDDVDVTVPRDTHAQLLTLLRDWRLDAPQGGAYHAWTAPLGPTAHQVHARHPDLPDVLMLDLLLADLSRDTWHYRRDPRITLPLARARRTSAGGLPYLAPEAALLFKAGTAGRDPRGKDAQDFRRALPTLDSSARQWLRAALDLTQPGHAWGAQL